VSATREHKILLAIEPLLASQVRWLGSASNAATVGSALARPNANFCKSRLPADQAAPLWQAAQAQAMTALEGATPSRVSTSAILFMRSYRKSCKADNYRDEYRQNVEHWVTP
jgi:hypothetical protein